MIHYTCDCCKRVLDPEEELRYVVSMEAYAVMDPSEPEQTDDDRDHLLEVHEILEQLDEEEADQMGDHLYQKLRFDLCPKCHRRFIKNPLGLEHATLFGFSSN